MCKEKTEKDIYVDSGKEKKKKEEEFSDINNEKEKEKGGTSMNIHRHLCLMWEGREET